MSDDAKERIAEMREQNAQALELAHLLTAIAENGQVGPVGATFLDGYRATRLWETLAAPAGASAP